MTPNEIIDKPTITFLREAPNGTKIRLFSSDKVYMIIHTSSCRMPETLLFDIKDMILGFPNEILKLHEKWKSQFAIHLVPVEV